MTKEENSGKATWPIVELRVNSLREVKRKDGKDWFSKLLFAYLSPCPHKQPPLRGVNQPFNKATAVYLYMKTSWRDPSSIQLQANKETSGSWEEKEKD